jgi:hypothetical protein
MRFTRGCRAADPTVAQACVNSTVRQPIRTLGYIVDSLHPERRVGRRVACAHCMGIMLPLSEINGSRSASRRREVIEVRGFADFPEHQCNTYLASDWRRFYGRPPIATPIGSAPADRRHLPEVRKCSWFGLTV